MVEDPLRTRNHAHAKKASCTLLSPIAVCSFLLWTKDARSARLRLWLVHSFR